MNQKDIPKKWLAEFNVNIKFIDEQHQYFFRILKNLERNIKTRKCKEGAADIFFSLVHYADHFLITEEIYLKDLNYPKIDLHKEKHTKFVSSIIKMKDDFANGNPRICVTLLNFMTEYLHEHILGYDVMALEYLKKEGI